MAITVKHSKVSTIPDADDTSLVRPSDWNADHTLIGLGTMAEQDANNVNITGGSITGVSGLGDVTGPASATDNAITRFDGTTGKLIQNSTVTIDDNGNVINANSVGLDTTPATVPTTVGTISWDDGDGVPTVALKGGNINLQVGTQEYARVFNDSGTTLTKGQAVYISGAQGNRVAVKLARADVEATSFGTIGLVAETMANGAEGFIIVSGALYKLDTSALVAGATVYVSPTTAGALTTTKPQAPDQLVVVGWVERVDNIVGSIYVKVDNGYELDELHDVRITSPQSGNVLIYDASTTPIGVWKNANLTDGTGISITEGAGSVTIANTGVTALSAGTGISVSGSTGSVTVTNTAPDQTVALTAGTGISTSGTYPNFTITNTAPDQVVALTGAGTTSISGTYPNFTITSNDQYTGTVTSVSGTGTVSGLTLSGTVTGSGNLTLGGAITGFATSGANTDITSVALTTGTISTTPVNNTDIVNKQYADAIASGIHFHEAVSLATTAALPANTYNNGTSGVGATLTATANGALSVDSTLTVVGERVLVKNEVTGANNGVYVVTQVGSAGTPYILTRASDFNTVGSGVNQIDEGDFFLVTGGVANINTAWVQQTPPPITIGTTSIVFQQFAAPITYTAGTGLSESPPFTFNIANTGTAGTYGSATLIPVITTNAQGQVTNVTTAANPQGTVTSVSALTLGTTGTDLNSSVANGSTTPVITLNVPTASSVNRGALSSTDWSTFNGKQDLLVSGTNIKTVNSQSLLGSGNITVTASAGGADTEIQYNNAGALAGASNLHYDGTNLGVGLAPVSTSWVKIAAGTTTKAPLEFNTSAGTLMTTPDDGSFEYDGSVFYATPIANSRGVMTTEHFVARTGTKTMVSNTNLQSLFGGGTGGLTNGALTVASTETYFFEASINMSSMSGTSGNIRFSIVGAGTATFTSAAFHAFGLDSTTQATAAAAGTSFTASQTATGNIVTAATGTAVSVYVKGIFRIDAAGTIIPSVQLTTAAAAVIGTNTWFKCHPVGSNTVISVGNWS